ncbi:patatin-related protein [Paramicrobacterium humi]|uniref:Patatin-related protein n=1 Tax=Paramicrobacterium humi TaxID=640635 RepID=A0A1H4PPJ4_9MICO|nr:DUF3376 domain-containing protein [Microbacterium humi]SEC09231.1 patatin-related protein [Microbacterium humi]
MRRSAASLPVVALGLGTDATARIVSEDALGEGVHGHILRVALALRGGVSLAVWIGGTIAELDMVRRIRLCRTTHGWDAFYVPRSASEPPPLHGPELRRARVYARMLAQAGYDGVEFDVLAGASAGGLNAVVYAVAQRASASADSVLGTWQDAADVRRLLHGPGVRPVDSVMRGDEYFWPRLTRALHELYDEQVSARHPLHRSARVSVDLAATVIDSAARSDPEAKDTRGYFHFIGTDDGTASEVGRRVPDAPGDGSDLSRLSYAARSTSSFPGAFEPALVFSKVKRADESVAGDATHVDMSYAFSGHRADWNHPFRIIDGSILDDVPVDQAFRAIRRSASSVPSSRALLYLDPLPPSPPPRSVRPSRYGPAGPAKGPLSMLRRLNDRQSQLLTAIRAGRQTLGARESGEEEIAQVERYRIDLLRESGRGDAYAATTTARFNAAEARLAYVRFRAAADVQFFSGVVTDPGLWQLGVNSPRRVVWRRWSDQDRERLDEVALPLYENATEAGLSSPLVSAIADGPQAALDAALCALSWVRALETLPQRSRRHRGTPLADLRLALYRVLGEATDARDLAAAIALDAGRDSADRTRAALLAWVEANAAADTVPLWSALNEAVTRLRAISPRRQPETGDETEGERAWIHNPFSGVPLDDRRFTAHDLAPFLAPRGIPEPVSSLSFARITGDEAPARPEEFIPLVRGREKAMARLALRLHPSDLDEETVDRLFGVAVLTADDKLAGSQLWNFGGFLSTDWRTNDWWWGRLDAAAGLVRILDRQAHAEGAPTQLDPNAGLWKPPLEIAVDAVQSALLEDLAESADPPLAGPPDADSNASSIRRRLALGADTLDNLIPRYRLGVLSRIIRVASRALDGSSGLAGRIGIAAARPFAVAIPLITVPLRAAVFGAVVGLAVAVVAAVPRQTPEELRPFEALPAYAIIGAIALALLAGFIDAYRRWSHLVRSLDASRNPASRQALPRIRDMRSRALLHGGAYGVVSLATLCMATVFTALLGVSSTWWILIAASGVLALRSRYCSLDSDVPPTGPIPPILVTLAYAAWLAAVIVMPTALAPFGLDHRWLAPATTAIAAAICALLLTAGWLAPRTGVRSVLAQPVTIALAAGVGSGIPVWFATRWLGTPFPVLTILTTLLIMILIWGTIVWWLPETPGVPDDAALPDDSRRDRPV